MESDVKIKSIRLGDNVKLEPKVSVIIPAYNAARFIAETLDSALSQTFKDFEIIVVNDGSPDTADLDAAIKPYLDDIIYISSENHGAAIARNIAIKNASGVYLAFLDGDDVWFSNYLESQISFLESNSLDMVYCDAEFFGDPKYAGKKYMEISPSSGTVTVESLLKFDCNVITSGTVLRRKTAIDAGMFEWERVHAEDFMLWVKVVLTGARVDYQRSVLLKYRSSNEGLSGDSLDRALRGLEVFRRVKEKLSLSRSETEVLDKMLEKLDAEFDIVTGKAFMVKGDLAASEKCFATAFKKQPSMKLRMVLLMFKISPWATHALYMLARSSEIELK